MRIKPSPETENLEIERVLAHCMQLAQPALQEEIRRAPSEGAKIDWPDYVADRCNEVVRQTIASSIDFENGLPDNVEQAVLQRLVDYVHGQITSARWRA